LHTCILQKGDAMFIFSYLFDWLSNHLLWVALGVFVFGTTIAIMWKLDR
jgi:hypothetical protein